MICMSDNEVEIFVYFQFEGHGNGSSLELRIIQELFDLINWGDLGEMVVVVWKIELLECTWMQQWWRWLRYICAKYVEVPIFYHS